jgi:DNA-binding XRE family transcriptional regulator
VPKRLYREDELGSLAKEFRARSKKTKDDAASELGVRRSSIQLAEENPEQSLFKLRKRMIERYSKYKLTGPVYFLEER